MLASPQTAGSTFQKISQVFLKTGDLNGPVFPTNSSPSTPSHSSSLPMSFPQPTLFRLSTRHTSLARPHFAIHLLHLSFNSILKHMYSSCSTGQPMHSRTLRSSSLGTSSNTFSIDAIPGKLPENPQRNSLLSVLPVATLEVLLSTACETKPTYPFSFSSLRAESHQSRKLR